MCNSWTDAYSLYDWAVDLRQFNNARNYPAFFNRIIQPNEIVQFEDIFRQHINENGSYQIAGEVCFWKNYGNHMARNRVTESLLRYLSIITNWDKFAEAIREISGNPTLSNFHGLRNACSQPRGFATPPHFLSILQSEWIPYGR